MCFDLVFAVYFEYMFIALDVFWLLPFSPLRHFSSIHRRLFYVCFYSCQVFGILIWFFLECWVILVSFTFLQSWKFEILFLFLSFWTYIFLLFYFLAFSAFFLAFPSLLLAFPPLLAFRSQFFLSLLLSFMLIFLRLYFLFCLALLEFLASFTP